MSQERQKKIGREYVRNMWPFLKDINWISFFALSVGSKGGTT